MDIKKVISVSDTRDYEEIGDKWYPIPGSGIENPCARCGRSHEVHWTVQLADDSVVVVGGTCAKSSSMDCDRKIRSVESAVKTLARWKAELAKLERQAEERQKIENEVEVLPLPEITHRPADTSDGSDATIAQMGDASVWCRTDGFTHERRSCLIGSWREKRISERTGTRMNASYLRSEAKYLKKRIEKKNNQILEKTKS